MSASVTQRDPDEEISNYLNRNVKAAVLPKKWGKETTYPPLLLDAASGTGKTQQAFALVKAHKWIIYFLMSEPSTDDQEIYQKMRERTNDELKQHRFAHRVEVAIKALGEDENNKDEDICSVKLLLATINAAGNKTIHFIDEERWVRDTGSDVKGQDQHMDVVLPNAAEGRTIVYNTEDKRWAQKTESDVKGLGQLMDVVLWMCSKRLQVVDGLLKVVPIKPEGKTSCTFKELCSELKDIILFVDEALPVRADEDREHAINRLRFVRNLGRALTMKVVLAGTAATAANMIAEAPNAASRKKAPGEMAWIECQLLWKPMSEDEVRKVVLSELEQPNDLGEAVISEGVMSELEQPNDLGKAVISALAKGRPYLVHLFGRVMKEQKVDMRHINSDNLRVVLTIVGEALQLEKRMSDESHFIYFTGAFLDQRHTSPCAFPVKPAQLVRGHYFEPCVVLDVNRNVACGVVMGKRSLASGHQRVKLYRYPPPAPARGLCGVQPWEGGIASVGTFLALSIH